MYIYIERERKRERERERERERFMWTLIVVFTAAEGGLMEPTVAAVRRLDLCGCSKQR